MRYVFGPSFSIVSPQKYDVGLLRAEQAAIDAVRPARLRDAGGDEERPGPRRAC